MPGIGNQDVGELVCDHDTKEPAGRCSVVPRNRVHAIVMHIDAAGGWDREPEHAAPSGQHVICRSSTEHDELDSIRFFPASSTFSASPRRRMREVLGVFMTPIVRAVL